MKKRISKKQTLILLTILLSVLFKSKLSSNKNLNSEIKINNSPIRRNLLDTKTNFSIKERDTVSYQLYTPGQTFLLTRKIKAIKNVSRSKSIYRISGGHIEGADAYTILPNPAKKQTAGESDSGSRIFLNRRMKMRKNLKF